MRKNATEAQTRERMGLCRGSDANLSFWDICFWADQTQRQKRCLSQERERSH